MSGQPSNASEPSEHLPGWLLEPSRDQRGRAGRQRGREQRRRDQVDVAVDDTWRGDQPIAHDRVGMRPDRQVDPVADVGVARPADPDDPAVLDPDVGLDDPDRRVDEDDAGDHDVELGWPGRGVRLAHPAPDVLGVAPQRLVARIVHVALDPQPQVGVTEPDAVVGRRPVASVVPLAREAGHRPASPDPIRPPNRTSSTTRS